MIELLPKWNLHGNRPSFYDTDSVTLLELASRLHGTMNELITDYNAFSDRINSEITSFMSSTNKDLEAFETAMRQEFQDFIDVINIKYAEQQKTIDEIESVVRDYEHNFASLENSLDMINEHDESISSISDDVEFLKEATLGNAYDFKTVNTTGNPITVPSNSLGGFGLDKIGTGIKQEVINKISSVENSYIPYGVTANYSDGIFTINSTNYTTEMITFNASYPIASGKGYYLSVEVISGSYEIDNGGSLNVGETMLATSVGDMARGEAPYEITGGNIVINTSALPVKYNNLVLKISIGTDLETLINPIISIQHNGETIFTVPEEIRNLMYYIEGVPGGEAPVYGRAMNSTIYNYLDLENKVFVVKCGENENGILIEKNDTIDVSEYLSDTDGILDVNPLDEITFIDEDGNLVEGTVPGAYTYIYKKG